jgi:hypothetical protein
MCILGKERFDLLCLEEGEVYFDEYGGFYFPPPPLDAQNLTYAEEQKSRKEREREREKEKR